MKTYCFRKYTGDFSPQKVTMINKVIKQKSRCSSCVVKISRFLKQKSNNIISILTFSYNSHYKTCLRYCLKCKKEYKNANL